MKRSRGFLLLMSFLAFLTLSVSSCTKEPGEGGTSKIIGKVYVREYSPAFTYLLGEYWAADEEVFLIYGDGVTYDERIWTGPDGDFEFPYLRKGKYQIYIYSDDSTMTAPSGTVAVFRDVEITKNGETVDVGTINIVKH